MNYVTAPTFRVEHWIRQTDDNVERPLNAEEVKEFTNAEIKLRHGKPYENFDDTLLSLKQLIARVEEGPASLDLPIGEDEDVTLGDFVADDATPPEERAEQHLLSDAVTDVLASLPSRDRRVLELRFGIEDGRARTLEEVGREFGVTRERIRQLEARAFRKLRHPSRAKHLRGYLGEQ